MYDYGWRQYMPDVGRWIQSDPLVEDTEDPYAYVYNNPIKLSDPDGRAPEDGVEDCCNNLKGFAFSVVDNFTGGNLAGKYNDGSSSYNNGVKLGNSASFVAGAIMATSGGSDVVAGGTTLAASTLATETVVGAEFGNPGMALGAGLVAQGTLKVAVGGTLMSNATKNMQSGSNSSNGDSSKKSNPKKEAREAGKVKRENQPASEKRAKDYGKQLEKEQGKDARRNAHDAKDKIGKDRTVKELKEDYKRK